MADRDLQTEKTSLWLGHLDLSRRRWFLVPLAISLAFGLTAATALVLFVIPAFYMVLHDFGLFRRHDSLRPAAGANF